MRYKPSEKEFDSVVTLGIDKRVKYFRNVVGEHCIMWLSYDEEGNLFANYDTQDRECIYVWPAQKYGEFFFKNTKFNCDIGSSNLKPLDIHDFLDEYIDELIEQNIKIMIFPTEHGGALMSAESFRNMMIEELLKYEDFE